MKYPQLDFCNIFLRHHDTISLTRSQIILSSMSKGILLGLTITAIIVAGLFAFSPAQEASSARSTPLERDNTTVTDISVLTGQKLVLVDNRGIGGLSEAEVTWIFNPDNCLVQMLPVGKDPSVGTDWRPMANDGAFGTFAGHADTPFPVEAIALSPVGGNTCTLNPATGEYVTVSTVLSTA